MSFLDNSHPALALLIACSVKETVLLIAAWIITLFLHRRSAALRHHVWAAVILSALALPVFTFLLPHGIRLRSVVQPLHFGAQ